MRFRFEMIYRAGLLALFFTAFWAVWASAQTNHEAAAGNTVTETITNAPGTNSAVTVTVTKKEVLEKDPESPAWVESLAVDWPFLQYYFLGNEVWKYLFSLIYIFLAFYISKLLDYLTRVWLKQWTAKTKTKLDDLLLDLLNGPVKVISFVIFLSIGLDVFQ